MPEVGKVAVVAWPRGGASSQALDAVRFHLVEQLGLSVEPRYRSGDAGLQGSKLALETKSSDKVMLVGAVRSIETWFQQGLIDYGLDDVRIYTIARNYAVLSVPYGSRFETIEQLIEDLVYMRLTVATAGEGSAGNTVARGLEKLLDTNIRRHVASSGTNAAIDTSVGKADFVGQLLSEQIALIRAGDLVPLAVMGPDSIEIDGKTVPSVGDFIGGLRFATTFGLTIRADASDEFKAQMDAAWDSLNIDDDAARMAVDPVLTYGDEARAMIDAELTVETWATH